MTCLLKGAAPGSVSSLAAWLESQYDLKGRHPERGQLYENYAARSEELRRYSRHECHKYAEPERCAIDWFPAANDAVDAGRPLFIFIHGGFWLGGDRQTFNFLAGQILRHDVSAAFIGYELAPKVTVTDIVNQVTAAVNWLISHAETLGFDPTRISICGHSAGGHLAALLSTFPPSTFQGYRFLNVMPISGIFSLEPMLLTTINHEARISPAEVRTLSPLSSQAFFSENYIVAAGSLETQAFIDQSEEFQAKLHSLQQRCSLHICDGRSHFSIFEEFSTQEGGFLSILLREMHRVPAQR